MKKYQFLLIFLSITAFAQNQKVSQASSKDEVEINPLIKGSLYTPSVAAKNGALVIIIAGSGPTDRDGNQPGALNNSLRFLAEGLAADGISAFGFDKRIIAQMKTGEVNESELTFELFIQDAKDVVSYFRKQNKYKKIIIAGHSEGSLIGIIASQTDADGFISIAGPGRPVDILLTEQISRQLPDAKEEVQQYFSSLKAGKSHEFKNPMLAGIFRKSVDQLFSSWMKYDPAIEIKKLKIPILILNGNKDLQVAVSEAELLKQARKDADFLIVDKMNHVLKIIEGDDAANVAAYTNPDQAISAELITAVSKFVKSV